MSVNPGFMGQPFIIEVLEKVRVAKTYRDKHHLQFDIAVEGGVTDETVGPCVTAGRQSGSGGRASRSLRRRMLRRRNASFARTGE